MPSQIEDSAARLVEDVFNSVQRPAASTFTNIEFEKRENPTTSFTQSGAVADQFQGGGFRINPKKTSYTGGPGPGPEPAGADPPEEKRSCTADITEKCVIQ